MRDSSRVGWLIPAGLLALSFVPVVAGLARVVELTAGTPLEGYAMRFSGAPGPVISHIAAATTYCVLGAFQFAPTFRRLHPRWHHLLGRVLIPLGLVTAFSGLWMSQFYPRIETDSPTLYAVRTAVGSAMTGAILLGLLAIWRRDFSSHGAWMIRAYALGQGAGTQVFTHLPWFLLIGTPGPQSKAVLMTAGWLINAVVAEWMIASLSVRRLKQTSPIPDN